MEEKDQELRLVKSNLLTKYLDSDLVEFLLTKTPKELIEERPIRGGGTAKYVEGWRFVERLNQAFGFLWGSRIANSIRDGDDIVVQGEISFKIPGRTIIREFPDGTKETVIFEGIEITKAQFGGAQVKRYSRDGSGYSKGDQMDLGNDYKAAGTDMLKKCAISMGMFQDVYSKRGEESGPNKAQLDAVYGRGEKMGWSKEETDKWVEEAMGKKLEDCDSSEVMSSLLPKLIKRQQETKA